MLLGLEDIKRITRGCARIEERDGAFVFMRFTEKQAQAYLDLNSQGRYDKSFSGAGVRLAFRTNSERLDFDYRFYSGSSRSFGHFDVYIDGKMKHHFGSYGAENTSGHIHVPLPAGDKTVELHFPWSYRADLSSVTVDDGSYVEGVRRAHTMIAFGDSITHGYDAIHPSLSYVSVLSSLLDADCINKGIGGDIFLPALLDEAECEDPDYITVAYGSNDWCKSTPEEFEANCRGFLSRIASLYPKSKIFIIAPIWHANFHLASVLGMTGAEQNARIKEICEEFPSLHYIDGVELTPNRQEFFTDKGGHPTEACFALYAANLFARIIKTK